MKHPVPATVSYPSLEALVEAIVSLSDVCRSNFQEAENRLTKLEKGAAVLPDDLPHRLTRTDERLDRMELDLRTACTELHDRMDDQERPPNASPSFEVITCIYCLRTIGVNTAPRRRRLMMMCTICHERVSGHVNRVVNPSDYETKVGKL